MCSPSDVRKKSVFRAAPPAELSPYTRASGAAADASAVEQRP